MTANNMDHDLGDTGSGSGPDKTVRRGPRFSAGARARRRENEKWNLSLESVGVCVPTAVVADSPTLLMVAIEDVCWRIAMDDCAASRPHRWHRRAYATWVAQRERLEQKSERLRQMVDEQLLAW